MKSHFTSVESVNNLREIQALQRLSAHPNIVKMHEVLYDKPTGRLALVFELMELNIYELIRGRREFLATPLVKSYTYQLIEALDHMHRLGIFHRDIKPENILVSGKVLKLADFGSCRGIASKQPYTEYISTRWYRPPECLLTNGYYGHKMDIWGVGCVIFEVLALFPLFPGKDEKDQLLKIHKIIGTPAPRVLRNLRSKGSKRSSVDRNIDFSPLRGKGIRTMLERMDTSCLTMIESMLTYDEKSRVSATRALQSPWFDTVRDAEKAKLQQFAAASGGAKSAATGSGSEAKQQKKRDKRAGRGAVGKTTASAASSTSAVSSALQKIEATAKKTAGCAGAAAAAAGGSGAAVAASSGAEWGADEEEIARQKRRAKKKKKKKERREAERRDEERREAERRDAERRETERRDVERREVDRRAQEQQSSRRVPAGGSSRLLPSVGGLSKKSTSHSKSSTGHGLGSLPAASGANNGKQRTTVGRSSGYNASERRSQRRRGGEDSGYTQAQRAAQRRLQKARALQRRAREEESATRRKPKGNSRSYVSPYSQHAISKARS